jgi:AraC family transcriptional regulator
MDIDLRLPSLTSTMQIIGCHFGTRPPGWRYERHHHFLFEILHCYEGSVLQHVGDSMVTLQAGDWMLIKSGIPHESINDSKNMYRFFNVHFDLDDPLLRLALCQFDFIVLTHDELDPYADSQLAAVELAMKELQCRNTDTLHGSILFLHIQTYMLWLISCFSKKVLEHTPTISDSPVGSIGSSTATSSETTVAREIENSLRTGLHHRGSIGDIASGMGLSRSQCSKIFTKVYGQSPRQYVSRLTLNRAKHLLVYSTLPIERIAEQLGFESTSQFSRQFRRWTGMAPTHFRPRLTTATLED